MFSSVQGPIYKLGGEINNYLSHDFQWKSSVIFKQETKLFCWSIFTLDIYVLTLRGQTITKCIFWGLISNSLHVYFALNSFGSQGQNYFQNLF